jgi:hypothetical protein
MIMHALLLFVFLRQATFLDFKGREELQDVAAILEVFNTVALTMALLMRFFHLRTK